MAQAQHWYEEQQPGLSSAFHVEFGAAIERLGRTPLIYPKLYRDVRRAVLRRFPYLIWYRIDGDSVIVLACTHARIDPANLPQRLKS